MALFPWNMVMYVPEGSVTLAYDEYGNPVESSAAIAQYLVSVSEDNQQPVIKSNAGLDTAVTTYSGYCTGKIRDTGVEGADKFARSNVDERAKYLPIAVVSGQRFNVELIDPLTKQKQTGVFVILSAFQTKYRVVTKILGSRINGYFEFGR